MKKISKIASLLLLLAFCFSNGIFAFAANNTKYEVGDIIIFGNYEQDNNTQNGKEPIEWRVLNANEDNILVISRYSLDGRKYNDKGDGFTWSSSTIRDWLNSDFYNAAFSDSEKAYIIQTTVDNSERQGNSDWKLPSWSETEDNVFFLSYAEADRYFKDSEDRKCVSTTYAKAQGAVNGYQNVEWWLRSPGKASYEASTVNFTGDIILSCETVFNLLGVRPAMWIKDNPLIKVDTSLQTATDPAFKYDDTTLVWVTDNSTKYHTDPNCSNMQNPYQITIREALARNLEACDKC